MFSRLPSSRSVHMENYLEQICWGISHIMDWNLDQLVKTVHCPIPKNTMLKSGVKSK